MDLEEESLIRICLSRRTKGDDGIFISQDKYVADILKKFDFSLVKTANTPIETNKALLKDEEAEDVDVHLYRSMIGSLMYLTASRPDIMFVVCACTRLQVTPKVSHLHVVKRIFRYLKGQPKLGLWYPRDSPFDLEAFLDSDYDGASLDGKSTTGGCQFLSKRLISWQCKKQTIVADLLKKAFDVGRFQYLTASIRMPDDEIQASNGFQEIVHFLNESHIRFALTKNPTIYVSLIEKFWQTATVRTVDNGEQEITATVDGNEFTITEASVRRHLQLVDVNGISVLPTTEIFAQLSLMGYVLTNDKLTFQKAEESEGSGHPFEPQLPPSTAQPIHEEPIPNTSEPIPNVPDEAVYKEWDDRVERATTTAASLDATQTSDPIPNVPDEAVYEEWDTEWKGIPLLLPA
ncbi:hypothetical protein Tco_0134292 [Tanacetum coccineum]